MAEGIEDLIEEQVEVEEVTGTGMTRDTNNVVNIMFVEIILIFRYTPGQ